MTADAPTVLCQLARTAALRAALLLPEGETRSRVVLAADALADALEQRRDDLRGVE